MSIGSSALVPGMAFEVAYLIWKASCLEMVMACLECIVDKFELSMDVVPFGLKVVVLVVDLTIVLDLCKRVSALSVHHDFAEGVEGRGWAHVEIIEPGGHWVSGI